ncbi:hypothetical protein GQ53DRAFT_813596 [Thozetella sp. PMI_491]|nr:hypothetical protein GQ53DRAFT_813596 [Thozetella sp. PMI_491]
MADPGDNPITTPAPARYQFVVPEYEASFVYAATHKTARSFAAKEGHARARRKRVRHHQAAKQLELRPAVDTTGPVALRRAGLPLVSNPQNPRRPHWNPPTISVVYPSFPADPFAAAARPITQYEHGLLSHYLRVIVPALSCSSGPYPSLEAYSNGVKRDWLPLALTDPGMLDGILITVCRSLYALHGGGPYLQYALLYKLRCLASLQKSISKEGDRPRSASLAKAMLLAGDEASIGDFPTSLQHVQAGMRMVALMGGLAALGKNRYLQVVVESFAQFGGTQDAEDPGLLFKHLAAQTVKS